MDSFVLKTYEQRIFFDADHLAVLPQLLDDLGLQRAGIVSTPGHAIAVESIVDTIGSRHAATFLEAKVHTPVDVTQRALEGFAQADAVISLGGGSAIGLGKAMALQTGAKHIAIPTTYAGSEMTPILGQTENGKKTVLRDDRVTPDAVLYDVGLTLSLPKGLSMSSGFNALAHAIEGLYAPDSYPEASALAMAAIESLVRSLPAIARNPADRDARTVAMYGAYLAGRVLSSRTMGLHHKLAHVLGGLFDLPHAALHAALLPHVVRFNEFAAVTALKPAGEILGSDLVSAGLYSLARDLDVPTTLSEVGMPRGGIDAAASQLMENPGVNPRQYNSEDIKLLLEDAIGN